VNTFKSLCLGILLLAASYGVYVAVNGSPATRSSAQDDEGGDGVDVSVDLPELPDTEEQQSDRRDRPGGSKSRRVSNSAQDGPESEAPRFMPPSATTNADRPEHEQAPDAAAADAEAGGADGDTAGASAAGKAAEALPTGYVAGEKPFRSAAPPTPGASAALGDDFALALENAQVLLESGRLSEGLLELSRWYQDRRLAPEEQEYLVELLGRVAGTVIYSRQHLLERPYRVRAGDTLHRVAQQYNVPWRLLAKINGVEDPDRLAVGEELKVVPGPFDAVVDLSTLELTLFLHGRYAGRFRIGLGEDDPTPEGEYTVKAKEVNPTYYGPDVTIDQDDPENPLGELLLDLGGRVYLHATNDESSLGRKGGRGSVRLSAADMEDVFDILTSESEGGMASRVVIRR
jgi:LysM repeat protein